MRAEDLDIFKYFKRLNCEIIEDDVYFNFELERWQEKTNVLGKDATEKCRDDHTILLIPHKARECNVFRKGAAYFVDNLNEQIKEEYRLIPADREIDVARVFNNYKVKNNFISAQNEKFLVYCAKNDLLQEQGVSDYMAMIEPKSGNYVKKDNLNPVVPSTNAGGDINIASGGSVIINWKILIPVVLIIIGVAIIM